MRKDAPEGTRLVALSPGEQRASHLHGHASPGGGLRAPVVYPARGLRAIIFQGCCEREVSGGAVGAVAALPKSQRKEALRKRDKEHDKMRERWTEKVELVRAIRKKRREFW